MTPEDFKKAREFLCMSQGELATAYGYSGPAKISNYETGSRAVPRLLGELLERDVRIRTLHQNIDGLLERVYGRLSVGAVDKLEEMRAICLGIPETEEDPDEPVSALIPHGSVAVDGPATVEVDGWQGYVVMPDTDGGARFFYIVNPFSEWFRYDVDPRRIGPAHIILKEAIEIQKGGS